MNQEAQIADDISKLILSLKPSASTQFQTNMKNYSKKVLGAFASNTSIQSSQQLKQKIINKVSNSWDSKNVLQCQQTLNNILLSNTVQKKAQLLRMLLKTSDLIQKNTKNYSSIFKQSKLQQLNQTQQTMHPNNNNLSSLAFTKQRKSLNNSQLSALRNRGSVDQDISQADILRQITYTLQNIEASLISRDIQKDTFNLQNHVNVSQTVKRIVSQLCDIGWLYKKISQCISDKGSVEKSLLLAVQQELNQYYRWLAIIQNMIMSNQLSLRKLILWSYEPMEKLKWIAIVLEAVRPYQGCQIISIINSYRPQGSQSINQLLNRLLSHLVQPLLQFIYNWVYKGQLLDQKKQFFIEQKQKVSQIVEWFQRFKLIQRRIPNILDKQSALMIFNAGKTLFFLKNKCRCNYSLNIPFINPNQILSKQILQSSNILSLQFKKWLKSVYEDVSMKLVSVLNEQFDLTYHLNSMKHFFLMGKGDFIQHLADTLQVQLKMPKKQLLQSNLDGYISDAMGKSFTDFKLHQKPKLPNQIQGQKHNSSFYEQKMNYSKTFKANIVDRLITKIVDYGHGQDSWDVFNFQYSMDQIEPLYSVIKPDFISNYQKIFHFLWRIKRKEQYLKQIWLNHIKIHPRKKNKKFEVQGRQLIFRANILRTNMFHFISNLFGYLMIAIQAQWNRFFQSIIKATSLDQIIREHTILQQQLLKITFNTPSKKNLSYSLFNILKSIQSLGILQKRISQDYQRYYQAIRNYQNLLKIARYSSNMTPSEKEKIEEEYPTFNQEFIEERLNSIEQLYQQTFKTFFDSLKKEGEDVSVLLFRLDFNQFYLKKRNKQSQTEKQIK